MTFRSGDIVLVPFPFTDLSSSKRRPALLIQSLGEFEDWLCLPVTSQGFHEASLPLHDNNLEGTLPKTSCVRVNRPTVLSEQIMLGRIASVKPDLLSAIQGGMCRHIGCAGYSVMEPVATYK